MDDRWVIREEECLVDVLHIVSSDANWISPEFDLLTFTLDGLVFTRGSTDDWDRWAEVIGDDAFSWDNMLPFLLKVSLSRPH